MKRSHKGLAALATMATSMAGGCGGGSSSVTITDVFTTESSTTSTLAPASAQGLYEGVASNGHFFNTLVLENDQYYIIYGNLAGELFTVTGLITGTGQSSGGGFNSADLKDFTPGGVVFVGSMSASFTPDVRFDGVVSVRGQGISFPGNSLPVERYNHDTPAGLAEIAGSLDHDQLARCRHKPERCRQWGFYRRVGWLQFQRYVQAAGWRQERIRCEFQFRFLSLRAGQSDCDRSCSELSSNQWSAATDHGSQRCRPECGHGVRRNALDVKNPDECLTPSFP